jgi:hypothetical protein
MVVAAGRQRQLESVSREEYLRANGVSAEMVRDLTKRAEAAEKEAARWEDEARLFCQNADHWRAKCEKAEAELLRTREIIEMNSSEGADIISDLKCRNYQLEAELGEANELAEELASARDMAESALKNIDEVFKKAGFSLVMGRVELVGRLLDRLRRAEAQVVERTRANRAATQRLVEAFGSDGPEDLEGAVTRATEFAAELREVALALHEVDAPFASTHAGRIRALAAGRQSTDKESDETDTNQNDRLASLRSAGCIVEDYKVRRSVSRVTVTIDGIDNHHPKMLPGQVEDITVTMKDTTCDQRQRDTLLELMNEREGHEGDGR